MYISLKNGVAPSVTALQRRSALGDTTFDTVRVWRTRRGAFALEIGSGNLQQEAVINLKPTLSKRKARGITDLLVS